MGWVRVTFLDGSAPNWAAVGNAEADRADPLSDSAIRPPASHSLTAGQIKAQDEAGA